MTSKWIRNLFKQKFQENIFVFHNSVGKNEWIIIHFVYGEDGKINYLGQSNHILLLQQLADSVQGRLNKMFAIGVSGAHKDIKELRDAYKEAKYVLNCRLTCQNERLFQYADIINDNREVLDFNRNTEMIFYEKIVSGKIDAAKLLLKKFFRKTYNSKISISNIQDTYLKIVAVINSAAEHLGFKEKKDSVFYYLEKEINEFYAVNDMIQYLCKYMDMIRECIDKSSTQINDCLNDSIIEDIKKYIQEYYFCDISLEDLAKNRYFMNPNYLGRLFKSKTQQSFSKVLLATRMSKAKEMLLNKDLSVAEVANLVGYNNTSYFISLFKKFFGETPGNYKVE